MKTKMINDKTGSFLICKKSDVIIETARTVNPNEYCFLGCVEDENLPGGKVKIRTYGKLRTDKIRYVYDRKFLCEF